MATVKHFTRREVREVMQIRGFSEVTISTYINHVRNLAEYFNKPPHTLQLEHIHEYQVFLVKLSGFFAAATLRLL